MANPESRGSSEGPLFLFQAWLASPDQKKEILYVIQVRAFVVLGNRNLCSFSCLLRDSLGHRSCWAMGKWCSSVDAVFMLCLCMCLPPPCIPFGLAWRSCDASCLHLSLLCFFPFSVSVLSSCSFLPPHLSSFSLPSLSSSQLPSQCGELQYVDLYFSGSLGAQPRTRCPLMLVTLRVSISVEFCFPSQPTVPSVRQGPGKPNLIPFYLGVF